MNLLLPGLLTNSGQLQLNPPLGNQSNQWMAAVINPVVDIGVDLALAPLGVVVVQESCVDGNVLSLPYFSHDELAPGP